MPISESNLKRQQKRQKDTAKKLQASARAGEIKSETQETSPPMWVMEGEFRQSAYQLLD